MGAHVSKIIAIHRQATMALDVAGVFFCLNLYIEWKTEKHTKKNDWDDDTKEKKKKKNTQTHTLHFHSGTQAIIDLKAHFHLCGHVDARRWTLSHLNIHNIFRRLLVFFYSCGACALIQYEFTEVVVFMWNLYFLLAYYHGVDVMNKLKPN